MRPRPALFEFLHLNGLAILLALIPFTTLSAEPHQAQVLKSRIDLIGATIHGQPPVNQDDLLGIEPACVLVLRHVKRYYENKNIGVWYVQLKGSPLLDQPENNIAKGALSFHHYCWGEVVRGRVYRETNAKKRRGLAEYAMSGSKYVIDHPEYRPQNWPYLSHVYVTMGTGYLLMKEHGSAINAFLMALQLNPRERNAYTNLADAWIETGKKAEALKHVTEGLRYFPKAKALTRRYQELGGKLPYPEPYPDIQTTKKTDTEPSAQDTPSTTTPTEVAAPDPEPQSQPALPEQPNKADTSNKDNPYCRFCAE